MDVSLIANAVVKGVVSLPCDFYLGLERTFQDLNLSDGGYRTQRRNFNDDRRVVLAIRSLIRDRNTIVKVTKIIINDVLSHLPEPALKKIYDALITSATTISSRTTLQVSVSTYLGTKVLNGMMTTLVTRLAMRGLTGIMLGGIVTQGVIARACEASRRLSLENPQLWQALYIHNYDMLYFLFEGPLKHFIEMGEILRKHPGRAEELIRAIENIKINN